MPKAVILGNHDAWRSFGEKQLSDALNSSLDALGSDHVAYDVREVPSAGVSVVGARPFSWGGPSLRSPELYDELYGVRTMRESAAAIVEAALSAQHRDLVILAHNGPTGLGSNSGDIYGKDFGKPGGDWGDHDLALALQRIEGFGLRVRAVIAGHMHHVLLHPRGAERTRFVQSDWTEYIAVRASARGAQQAKAHRRRRKRQSESLPATHWPPPCGCITVWSSRTACRATPFSSTVMVPSTVASQVPSCCCSKYSFVVAG